MYMSMFSEIEHLESGDVINVVSEIRRVKDTDEATREWERVGDVYSAYMLSDTPDWKARIITH